MRMSERLSHPNYNLSTFDRAMNEQNEKRKKMHEKIKMQIKFKRLKYSETKLTISNKHGNSK